MDLVPLVCRDVISKAWIRLSSRVNSKHVWVHLYGDGFLFAFVADRVLLKSNELFKENDLFIR